MRLTRHARLRGCASMQGELYSPGKQGSCRPAAAHSVRLPQPLLFHSIMLCPSSNPCMTAATLEPRTCDLHLLMFLCWICTAASTTPCWPAGQPRTMRRPLAPSPATALLPAPTAALPRRLPFQALPPPCRRCPPRPAARPAALHLPAALVLPDPAAQVRQDQRILCIQRPS